MNISTTAIVLFSVIVTAIIAILFVIRWYVQTLEHERVLKELDEQRLEYLRRGAIHPYD